MPVINKSLADKIKAIHIYSNGYKIQEILKSDFDIDNEKIEPDFPVSFSEDELLDQWVRIRPRKSSAFRLLFFDETPKRMFTTNQVKNTLKSKKPKCS
jgi:hypothetical protein